MPSVRTVVFLFPRWTIRAACLRASQRTCRRAYLLSRDVAQIYNLQHNAKTAERVLLYAESLATDIEKSHSRKKGVIWRPTGALVAADR